VINVINDNFYVTVEPLKVKAASKEIYRSSSLVRLNPAWMFSDFFPSKVMAGKRPRSPPKKVTIFPNFQPWNSQIEINISGKYVWFQTESLKKDFKQEIKRLCKVEKCPESYRNISIRENTWQYQIRSGWGQVNK